MSTAQFIPVQTPTGGYNIVIAPGSSSQFPEYLGNVQIDKLAIVTNTTLVDYASRLQQTWSNSFVVTLPDGEQHKTLANVAYLYEQFIANGLDRSGTVVAVGGGVVGDTAGFAAATYMRGVQLMQMPTSLLAMVDASVGGKVGVDLPQGKNLVGAFKQPALVLIDPEVLATLPEVEWRCGMAEVIKHGLLQDAGLLNLGLCQRSRVMEWLERAIRVKVIFVEKDPFEQDVRAHLNLGHTFAHAIEQISGYRWRHGEAVAVGLVAATRLSRRLQLCDDSLPEMVEQRVREIGLPTRLDFAADSRLLYEAMMTDKKRKYGRLRLVLLRGIGQPLVSGEVEEKLLLEIWENLC